MFDEKNCTTEKTQVGTVYDDVYRTLTVNCSRLLLPVLNEVFGECYSGDEYVDFSPNEHFMNRQDGEEEKRVTDNSIIIDMSKKVLGGIAAGYENVRKGVREVFGGKVLETEWDRRYRAGETDTKRRTAFMLHDMGIKEGDIAYALEVSVSKIEEWLNTVPV